MNADCIDKGMMYAQWSGYRDQFPKDYPAPCILYLDSGDKSYDQNHANRQCGYIKAWLDSKLESNPNAIRGNNTVRNQFTFKKGSLCSMRTIAVKVPLQTNDIDCGPFVCAFASQMLKLLDYKFDFNDVEDKCEKAITKSKYFDFGTKEITKFRASYQGVMNGLIHHYKKGKK